MTRLRARAARPARRHGDGLAESGAALVAALVLLAVLTLLGTSAMTTATLALAIANNAELQQRAFEAAEAGIELALARHDTAVVAISAADAFEGSGDVETSTVLEAITPVPDRAFSMGTDAGAIEALHFRITAVGRAARGASATHRQGFYVVVPATGGD